MALIIRAQVIEGLFGDYVEEAEGSLCATYAPRDPLAEFWRGEITPRQLRVLAIALPTTSALTRAAQGSAWTDAEWIAHDTNWQLRQLITLTLNINLEKGKSAPDPKPLPTPDMGESVQAQIEQEQLEQQTKELDEIQALMFGGATA